MCGICLFLNGPPSSLYSDILSLLNIELAVNTRNFRCIQHNKEKLLSLIERRGPSFPLGKKKIAPCTGSEICFYSSVLHLRGIQPALQPYSFPEKDALLDLIFNGEIFGGPLYDHMESYESDTKMLAFSLYNIVMEYCNKSLDNLHNFEKSCLEFLDTLVGPFSFIVYFKPPINQLWICRDKIGRRSLCFYQTDNSIIFTSVCGHVEISDTHVYEFPVDKILVFTFLNDHPCVKAKILDWINPPQYKTDKFLKENLNVLPTRSLIEIVKQLYAILYKIVKKRIHDPYTLNNTVGILFSGGLDSGILACISLQVVNDSTCIELINVAFGEKSLNVPDRLTSLITYKEITTISKNKNLKLICCNITQGELFSHEIEILNMITPQVTQMDFNIGAPLYFAACGAGVLVRKNFHASDNELWWSHVENDFKKKNDALKKRNPGKNASSQPSSPCVVCHTKLMKPFCSQACCRTCCKRKIQECIANISEYNTNADSIEDNIRCSAHRHSHSLLHKSIKKTDNEYSCLYENGLKSESFTWCDICPKKHKVPMIQATSKVLLSGHGADELFGGYGRYLTAYVHRSEDAFRQEIVKDLCRLWKRNLGRDDRCISNWGREARHPFLDEEVINFVSMLPISVLISAQEDKLLLRELARYIELENCSQLKKVAVQFGSRSSRQTNLHQFSSNRKAKGTYGYTPVNEIYQLNTEK